MKIINLPSAYLKEQLCIKIQNFLIRNMTSYIDKVVVLPRTLSVITKRMLENPTIEEAAILNQQTFSLKR